jgi:excisionase family DNA binding protein
MNTEQSARPPRKKLSTAEAAEYLGLGKSTLDKGRTQKGASTGSIPYIKIGARVLYDPDDLDAYTARNKRRSTSDTTVPAGA